MTAAAQRHRLKKIARGHKSPHRDKQRAQIVLDAARGHNNARIARARHVSEDTARKWRGRFADEGLTGLVDRARSGRPPRFTAVEVAEVKALACQLPAESGTPLSRWTCPELAYEAALRGIVESVSASTIRRWLADDALKPWQYRSWISIRDPNFRANATRVLDLYQRVWDGKPLGPDEYVVSSDEKPSIQARCRCHPTLPPGKGRAMRVEHEYDRGGALTYLAAYDVHRATLYGRCAASTGIEPFMALVEQVMSQETLRISQTSVLDRGQRILTPRPESHQPAHQTVPERGHGPRPVHASWLNQVEVVFSVVQRKALSPNDFTNLDQVEQRLAAFEQRYNANARPFKWKFTPADLDDLLARIERHEHEQTSTTP